MLKAEFIHRLKQNNVSEDAEKTKERLRTVWSPLAKEQREEILSLCGLKKTAIERAYKTGNVSAKILVAVSQVLELDPYYLAGKSDENCPAAESQDYVLKFLAELGYKPGKDEIVKQRRKRKAKPEPVAALPKTPADLSEETKTPAAPEQPPNAEPAPDIAPKATDLKTISAEISKLVGSGSAEIDKLAEDDIILMLRSLSVQAGVSVRKKEQLTLIKQLLLL